MISHTIYIWYLSRYFLCLTYVVYRERETAYNSTMKNPAKDARKKLGERVRELRKSAGFTQEELGEMAEMNYKFIGELERGRVNVSLDSIVKIAAALRVKTGDIFSKEKVPLQKVIVKEKNPPQFSPQDLQLIKKALRLLNKTFSKV